MTTSRPSREELVRLVRDFTQAFNREDLDAVMGYFADDAVYDEFNGTRSVGKDAIRKAFAPQFAGAYGRIRFHEEDLFVDAESGKAMVRWTCTLENDERFGGWRGLDLLHFRGERLIEKHTYAKAELPALRALEPSAYPRA